jgi:hypothetical protein
VRLARSLSALGLGAVCALARIPALTAQVVNTLDAGVSIVRYDGFLASGAASVAPEVRFESPRFSARARGTLLVFESGNRSFQGQVSGGGFSPAVGPLRAEVAAEAGTSAYAAFARFLHVLGLVRLHHMTGRRGFWLGATLGQSTYADTAQPTSGWEAVVWSRTGATWRSASARAMRVRDTTYADAEGRARVAFGRVVVDGSAGTRFGGRGGGHGVYGEMSGSLWLSAGLAVVAGGGRYPSDPARGSIPGRYVSLAMRLGQRALASRGVTPVLALRQRYQPRDDPPPTLAGLRFELRRAADGALTIRIHAPSASRVEIMGDFSEWQAIALVRTDGTWEVGLPLRPGLYRFNVRVDGGAWGVPSGVATAADDFDGVVATIVVP